MRGSGLIRTLAAALCLLCVAGCSSAAAGQWHGPGPTSEPSPVADAVSGYLHAVAADDPAEVRAGLRYAAPGSPALTYLEHQANRMQAELAGAKTLYPSKIRRTKAGAEGILCNPAHARCAHLGDIVVDGSGQVTHFSVNGQPIRPRLAVGDGTAVASPLGTFTFLTAYNSPRTHDLVVTLRIRAGDRPLSPRLYKATIAGPGGTRHTASNADGTTDVPAHSDTVVELDFPAAPPKGKVTLGVCGRTSCARHVSVTVTLPVR